MIDKKEKGMKARKTYYPIEDLFTDRVSSRAFSGESMNDSEIMDLFEAARWAPSSFNNQPWRFIYAKRSTASWDLLFNLLVSSNQQWAKNAAVLVVACAKKTFDNGKPARTAAFDTGAAVENLALQAVRNNILVHAMEGFDYDKARKELSIPDECEVLAMIAIGRHGKKEDLPADLQAREQPSDRKRIEEFVYEGVFKGK